MCRLQPECVALETPLGHQENPHEGHFHFTDECLRVLIMSTALSLTQLPGLWKKHFQGLLELDARKMHCFPHPPVSCLLIDNRNHFCVTDSISLFALATWKLQTKFLAQAWPLCQTSKQQQRKPVFAGCLLCCTCRCLCFVYIGPLILCSRLVGKMPSFENRELNLVEAKPLAQVYITGS